MIDDHPGPSPNYNPIMGNQPMIFDGRIFGSMVGAMWGLWSLSTVAVEKRLKMWQQNLSISITVDDGGHIGRDMSLTLFSSTIACLETHANRHVGPVGPKFRDAKEAPKEREKWSPTTLMIQASLFSPHDTWLIYCSISFIFLVTCLSCHVVFLHFLGSSSDSAPGASCDRSKLSSSKVPPQIWAKGVSLAKGKSAGKPWIYQPNNNAK